MTFVTFFKPKTRFRAVYFYVFRKGVIPLEAMDLAVNPSTQELVYAHGDDWVEYPMSLFTDQGWASFYIRNPPVS
jgi:hypothetical protein